MPKILSSPLVLSNGQEVICRIGEVLRKGCFVTYTSDTTACCLLRNDFGDVMLSVPVDQIYMSFTGLTRLLTLCPN